MVKVCMVLHHHYVSDPRARRYVDALADLGVEVDVLSLRDHQEQSIPQRAGVRLFSIPMTHEDGGVGRYVLEYVASLGLFTARLIALYLRNRYQIIQVHNIPDFLVFVALIPRVLGAKVVLDIRDPMPEFYLSKSKYKGRQAAHMVRLMQVQERLSARLAHAVITANTQFQRNLIGRGVPAEKVAVVNNLPDSRVFSRARHKKEERSGGEPFTLFYPGTIAPRYGLDIAVRALPLLVKEIPHIQLVILGPHSAYVHDLAVLAAQLGVSAHVELRPSVPLDEIPAQMSEADVGIYPALPDPHMEIATPTKVLEYAVMGLPIVASRLKVIEELFSAEALLLFEPGDVRQFAQCVLTLFRERDLRETLVRAMDSSFVCKQSWDDERGIYYAVLRRLLASTDAAVLFSERG